MDLIGWDAARFEEIRARGSRSRPSARHPRPAGHSDQRAPRGQCRVALVADAVLPGPPLLQYLEELDIQADRDLWRLRVPVQWVGRPADGGQRFYAGRVIGGTLRAGDEVLVLPDGVSTTVTEVDTLGSTSGEGAPSLSVTFTLADQLDVGRGAMLASLDDPPPLAREHRRHRLLDGR